MSIDARIYYPTPQSPGIVCEVHKTYVLEVGDNYAHDIEQYRSGRWVRLVEATADAIAALIVENSLAADEPDALTDTANMPPELKNSG